MDRPSDAPPGTQRPERDSSYRWVEHTAELELEIEAASERGVLEQAVAALCELLGGRPNGATRERRVAVSAADRPALLAGWLEELVFLAESEGFVATALCSLELREDGLEAAVAGVLGEPPPLVKAVTYHRLTFERSEGGYAARVVLDV
jgi:SHS2 domain-containing protein